MTSTSYIYINYIDLKHRSKCEGKMLKLLKENINNIFWTLHKFLKQDTTFTKYKKRFIKWFKLKLRISVYHMASVSTPKAKD